MSSQNSWCFLVATQYRINQRGRVHCTMSDFWNRSSFRSCSEKISIIPLNTGVHKREASEGSRSCHSTHNSYTFVGVPVLRATGYEGISPNLHACHFLILEAPLRQVKQSGWLKSMCISREMLFTPSPGQQWELAAKRITVRGELAVPMWEKKAKCVEEYNNTCETSSSKALPDLSTPRC